MNALPLILIALCVMAIAYRYYSAFIAAKVVALDDNRQTPAHTLYDRQNYHPTNKWVLFGHHFAAISGAGPLIGPVLAAQFGFLPGFLWLLIGVCLGGAVHDFVILAASIRRKGKSLAEIARNEISPLAGISLRFGNHPLEAFPFQMSGCLFDDAWHLRQPTKPLQGMMLRCGPRTLIPGLLCCLPRGRFFQ